MKRDDINLEEVNVNEQGGIEAQDDVDFEKIQLMSETPIEEPQLEFEFDDLSPSERLAQRLIQDPEIDFRDAQVGEQSLLNLQIDQFESQGRTKLANMANQLLVVDDKGEYIVSNEDAKLQLTGLIEIFKMNQGPQANEVDPDFENVFGEIRLATKTR